ncbi:hypothetical protein AC1031_003386 [Aphanomyces cochlioides]|nr:hypothetical protein AC1031_003386 [Aphanomyces cochlioides]
MRLRPMLVVLVAAATAVTADDSCDDNGVEMRNGEVQYMFGDSGYYGSVYKVCLDGEIHCRMDDGVLDQPSLPDIECDHAEAIYNENSHHYPEPEKPRKKRSKQRH